MSTMEATVLTHDQVSFYRDNGYVLVKGVLGRDEAKDLREECHDLAHRLTRGEPEDPTWGSARALADPDRRTTLIQCHGVQFHAAAFGRLLVDERFTSAAAGVLGSSNVQLHHTKMFIKPPETGSPFPLHQDHPFFPHARHTMAAAIFHFDDTPQEKGCVRVVPESHLQGPLPHEEEGGFHLPLETYPDGERAVCRSCPAAGQRPGRRLPRRVRELGPHCATAVAQLPARALLFRSLLCLRRHRDIAGRRRCAHRSCRGRLRGSAGPAAPDRVRHQAPLGIYFWGHTLVPERTLGAGPDGLDGLLDAFAARGTPAAAATSSLEPVVGLLAAEAARPDAASAAVVGGQTIALVLHTARAIVGAASSARLPVPLDRDRAVARTIERYLRDNADRQIRLRDVAAQVHLSERHTSRIFRRVAGTSIRSYLLDVRLALAVQRLLEEQPSVTEVARACGYPDVRHFITAFRRRTGRTPTQFRRQGGTSAVE